MSKVLQIDVEKAVQLYNEGKSVPEIARLFGCSFTTIFDRFLDAGIPIRPRKGRKVPKEIVNKILATRRSKFLKREAAAISEGARTCTKCGEYLPLSSFSRRDKDKEERRPSCKKCTSKYEKNHRPNRKRSLKDWWLRDQYGITIEDFERMLKDQGYKCAICFTTPVNDRSWNVDHDHKTGAVRKILCSKCNTGLGSFRDNTEYLESAIKYLKYFQTEGIGTFKSADE